MIVAAVKNVSEKLLYRIRNAALHRIHGISLPPEVTGDTGGKDPKFLKKLHKGDACWSTKKEILGFLVDGKAKLIGYQIPKPRKYS